jgi:hypothetical protein
MSRTPRYVLAGCLALLIWMTLSGWETDSTGQRILTSILAGFMGLIVIACLVPGRAYIALRLAAGVVGVICVIYFVSEVAKLLKGESQHLAIGEPSAVMAALAMIVFGIPSLAFALGGETVVWFQEVMRALRGRRAK